MNANPHEQRCRTIFGGVVGGQEKDEVIEDEDEGILRKKNSRDLGITRPLWMWYFITSSAQKDELSHVLGAFSRDSG